MACNFIYSTITSLDIAYGVSIARNLCNCVAALHMFVTKRIILYIKKNMTNFGLIYSNNKMSLELRCDANCIGHKASMELCVHKVVQECHG